ncbi:torso-like protein [Ctenocephalides felis]|uniref:torso-like protein n=1 Tax=Ctenocephalides felis TaxID=7515 RepID=UPI000E6E460C|nr:torso-like protein [Ctenocephalides felis]
MNSGPVRPFRPFEDVRFGLTTALAWLLLATNAFSGSSSGGGGSGSATTGESQLGLGRAVNVFVRYGYLSISMRVVPRNDTDWLFREPTVSVFRGVNMIGDQGRKQDEHDSTGFRGDFHMEFCDNLRQLLQAYFRDFAFERLDKPWRAFTAGWLPDTTARNLGINSSFVHGDHCYVLVRVSKYAHSAALAGPVPPSVALEDAVADGAKTLKPGDFAGTADFIKKYGSHYVASYSTGNSLYQVFVYSRSKFLQIKQRLKTQGVLNLTSLELLNYFSPWYVEHMGAIKCASGNKTVEQWANSKLGVQYYIFRYASLLKLHKDTALLNTLDGMLGNEALLQLDLRALTPVFKDPAKKKWFQEVIDNQIKLWEVNM